MPFPPRVLPAVAQPEVLVRRVPVVVLLAARVLQVLVARALPVAARALPVAARALPVAARAARALVEQVVVLQVAQVAQVERVAPVVALRVPVVALRVPVVARREEPAVPVHLSRVAHRPALRSSMPRALRAASRPE